MKRLALLVHGQHRFTGELTDEGDLAVQVLVEKLRPVLKGLGNVVVISAPTVQAADTARIVIGKLAVDGLVAASTSSALWSDLPHKPADMVAVTKLVDAWENAADVLVFVTHPAVARDFQAVCAGRLGVEWQSKRRDHSQAVVIDWHKKKRFFFE